MKNLLVPVIQALLALALVGLVVFAVWTWWRNSGEIARCREAVRIAVNEDLRAQWVDPVQSVDFTEASRVFGVPEVLEFSNYLFATDKTLGRHPVGQITGSYNRSAHVLDVDYDFTDGVRRDTHRRYTLPAGAAQPAAPAPAKK